MYTFTKIDEEPTWSSIYNYPFGRFMQIFFHSGARESELMEIKTFNVDLQNQQFLVVVNKGRSSAEYKKPIKNIVLPLWAEIINKAKEGQYLFSKGLKPGDIPINANQISRRWRNHIKGKLHITADFYSLKHSNLDEISAELSIQDAAKMASHTSIRTTEAHYATNEAQSQMDRLKNMNNSFS